MIVLGAIVWLIATLFYSLLILALCMAGLLVPNEKARIIVGMIVVVFLLAPLGCGALIKTHASDSLILSYVVGWVCSVVVVSAFGVLTRFVFRRLRESR
jgi:hypothetical protein